MVHYALLSPSPSRLEAMDATPLPPKEDAGPGAASVVRWLSSLLLSAFVFGLCAMFLGQFAAQTAAAVRPTLEARQLLRTLGNVDTTAAGTLSAIAPLPKRPVPAVAVQAAAVAQPAVEQWRVTAGVNVRSRASKNSERVGALEAGTVVTVSTQERGWVLVASDTGLRGWVYGTFLSRDETVASR